MRISRVWTAKTAASLALTVGVLGLAAWLSQPDFTLGQPPAKDAKKAAKKPAQTRTEPTAAEAKEITAKTAQLGELLTALRQTVMDADLLADVAVYHKAAVWIARHQEYVGKPNTPAATLKVLDRGLERARQLSAGHSHWASVAGPVARGYTSSVDGSVQPYGVVIPSDYDFRGSDRRPLYVVLHGRDGSLTEVKFLNSYEPSDKPNNRKHFELHVFGRTNNAYRWAGEADVWESLAAVRRHYRIDESRVVLIGFSMGGAGAWHLGLHHPWRWCSVEAGAGFTDTLRYARQKDLPDVVRALLHIYDAEDYALNAVNVPTVGYGGELDPQLQASRNIRVALEQLGFTFRGEGLVATAEGGAIRFQHVIGAKTEHKVDSASRKVMDAFHERSLAAGRTEPDSVRFVTYTLKYNRPCGWLTVEALGEHYRPAVLEAARRERVLTVSRADNITALSVARAEVDAVALPDVKDRLDLTGVPADGVAYLRRVGSKWEVLTGPSAADFAANKALAKRPGLTGPIDDAFTGPFLCVRGTGTPWNPALQAWADARLKSFAEDWNKWMRGELPIKADTEVTEADLAGKSLILFGDPGSNLVLAKLLPKLPIDWRKDKVELAGQSVPAGSAGVLIAANPLSVGTPRYVVVNSGHSFGRADFAGTNALLFPRVGDWAIFRIGSDTPTATGTFGEDWKPRR